MFPACKFNKVGATTGSILESGYNYPLSGRTRQFFVIPRCVAPLSKKEFS